MAKYRKKPVVVEAITFEEFIEYGKNNGGNIVRGLPWSFKYKGHHVTHENNECYLIPNVAGVDRFTPEDMLITGVKGEIYPIQKEIFEATYLNSELSNKVEEYKELRFLYSIADDHTRCPRCKDQLYFCDCMTWFANEILNEMLELDK